MSVTARAYVCVCARARARREAVAGRSAARTGSAKSAASASLHFNQPRAATNLRARACGQFVVSPTSRICICEEELLRSTSHVTPHTGPQGSPLSTSFVYLFPLRAKGCRETRCMAAVCLPAVADGNTPECASRRGDAWDDVKQTFTPHTGSGGSA